MIRVIGGLLAQVKQLKFAKLYTRGPYQGQWEAAAKAAGYKTAPSKSSMVIRELIGAEGGQIPHFFQPQEILEESISEPSHLDQKESGNPPPLELSLDLPSPNDPQADEKWELLAKEVMPIWRNIAMGNVEANATQRQVLQNILDRGFGKAGQKVDVMEEEEVRVVVLPALGAGAGLHICPRCNYATDEE